MRKQEVTEFVASLRACAKNKDLYRGSKLHDDILEKGLLQDCSSALVIMYAKCGALSRAEELLVMHKCRTISSWTALIVGYTRKGQGQEALNCLKRMQLEGLAPDAITYACILKACGSIKAVDEGEQVHDEVVKRGLLKKNVVLGNALVDMYCKCGALAKAQEVLEELPVRDVVSWSTLIAGYAQFSHSEQALTCLERMRQEGLSPNRVTFLCILKACGSSGAAERGEQIHNEIARHGMLDDDTVLGNAVVDMYVKCGALKKAQRVLEELCVRDVVSWNVLITGYTQEGQGQQALSCFQSMQDEGVSPNAVTFACVLKACGSIKAADKGEEIHDKLATEGLLANNLVLSTAIMDMYAKCGAIAKAARLLEELRVRDVVSWNAMIAGYAQEGHGNEALKCYEQLQREGLSPNTATFLSILKACGFIGVADKGQQVHNEIARHMLLKSDLVLGNALMDMYVKCRALQRAKQVLEELPSRDIVSWNSLIAGYADEGEGEKALDCFDDMKRDGLSPDAMTFLCILKVCGCMGASNKGEQIHREVARQGFLGDDLVLGSALVDMYAKCGALAKAHQALNTLKVRDVSCWNALVAGYAQHGQRQQAENCLDCMEEDGLYPNSVTFLCALNACSHVGFVEDAQTYFLAMSTKYGIKPNLEHYVCMIDLFGRAGHLDEAVWVIERMQSQDCVRVIWSALLGACWKWGDVSVGKWAFEHLVQVDPTDATAYLFMAHIYSAAGMHEDAKIVEAMRIENKAGKKQDHSYWINMSA